MSGNEAPTSAGPTEEFNLRRHVWRRLLGEWSPFISLIILGGLILIAVAAPLLASDRPILMHRAGELSMPFLKTNRWPEYTVDRIFNLFLFTIFFSLFAVPAGLALRRLTGTAKAPHWGLAAAALAAACYMGTGRPQIDQISYKDLRDKLRPGEFMIFPPIPHHPYGTGPALKKPSREHLLGTDNVGRDMLARLIHGTRVALAVGVVAVGIAVLIGTILGALAGYFRGRVDMIISRLIEIMLCFPTFFLIITVVAFVERDIMNIMLVIGLTSWTGAARLVRGEVMKQSALDYVTAARASGANSLRIIFRHILPNSIAPVLVAATFGIAGAILTESGLSFLGYGTGPPQATWGELLDQARQHWQEGAWWLILFPGLAIFVTATSLNLVGEAIRDAIDPRLKV